LRFIVAAGREPRFQRVNRILFVDGRLPNTIAVPGQSPHGVRAGDCPDLKRRLRCRREHNRQQPCHRRDDTTVDLHKREDCSHARPFATVRDKIRARRPRAERAGGTRYHPCAAALERRPSPKRTREMAVAANILGQLNNETEFCGHSANDIACPRACHYPFMP